VLEALTVAMAGQGIARAGAPGGGRITGERGESRSLGVGGIDRRRQNRRQGTVATFGVAGEEEARSVGRPVAAREGDSDIRRREPPVQGDGGREDAR
jgi:hypothetical protein